MKKTVLVSITLFLAGVIFSQEAPKAVTLTVDQAVDYALTNSYQIRTGAIDLGLAKRKAKNAPVSTLLPSVQLSGSALRNNEYTDTGAMMEGIYDMVSPLYALNGIPLDPYKAHKEVENDHWGLTANVGISWNFSVAMIDQIQAAHLSYAAGQITWEQTLRETELNVRKIFYALLVQKEQLEVEQTALRNARDRMTQAQTNFQNGRIPELSYLQTRVAYEN